MWTVSEQTFPVLKRGSSLIHYYSDMFLKVNNLWARTLNLTFRLNWSGGGSDWCCVEAFGDLFGTGLRLFWRNSWIMWNSASCQLWSQTWTQGTSWTVGTQKNVDVRVSNIPHVDSDSLTCRLITIISVILKPRITAVHLTSLGCCLGKVLVSCQLVAGVIN